MHCLYDPQVINLCKFFFKTGSQSNIQTFKYYVITVFSVFRNKRYLNRPQVSIDTLINGHGVD